MLIDGFLLAGSHRLECRGHGLPEPLTGFAKATSAFCGTVPVGLGPSFALPVLYVGPQGVFAGLDQLNLELPKTIPSGAAEIECGFLSGSFHFTIGIR